jgi:guanylate cyclase
VTVAGAVVFGLLATFVRQREDALAALQVEQDRAEELLLNILPRSIADRLKAETATIADQFAEATILFADIVDFTPLSDRLQPAEVVGLLDDLFTHFDLLAERHGVEKIKTIGDCYMVAAGVPSPRADHAHVIGQMAIEMRDAMRSEHGVAHLGLEIRIGINSGPVVAGIIGRKRFLYDLWGDAVNMASRMESSGTAGQIQVTQATHDLLQDAFRLEPRGTVPIKGKGEVETWYLVGRKPSSQTVDDLILDLIEWIGPGERPYAETMEAWRTSCPRLPVWEDATDRGFIERDRRPGEPAFVAVTPSGKAHLAARRGSTASA